MSRRNCRGILSIECLGQNLSSVYNTQADTSTEGMIYFSKGNNNQYPMDFLKYKILVSKNGKQIPIEENISSIINDNGKMIGKVITFRDITARREAQLEILTAKDFYLNFFEKFPVLIWRSNKKGQFNYFNTSWLEFTGRGIDSQIFRAWLEFDRILMTGTILYKYLITLLRRKKDLILNSDC